MRLRRLGFPVFAVFAGLGLGCGSSSSGSASPVADSGGATEGSTGTDSAGAGSGDGAVGSDSLVPQEGSTPSDAATRPDGGAPGPAPIAGLRIFFTDLVSGPSTGGQSGKGAFVTVYGNGFGGARGTSTVTIGGGPADNYAIWTNTKIAFQLGTAAQTGNLVVHVPSKGDSNAMPFAVRAGNIFFVSSAGKDSNSGTYASPWATIPKAKNTIQQGDIAYIGTGAADAVAQTALDSTSSYKCALGMSTNDGTNSGTAAAPKALVVYPGATATIGDPNSLERGILTPGITGSFDYWVIAGFTLRGQAEAIELQNQPRGWRIVGNDISCPNGSGLTGCVTGAPTDMKFYGNVVHDAAAKVTQISKYYHAVYWAGNGMDMGWNTVRDGKTCRAIQFHNTGGANEFDLHVHDNVIHGTVCDGLNFATVDPSQGTVEAYNNVIYDVGMGPDPVEASADYAGVYVAGETDMGPAGGGTVQVYNNTLYNCGSWTANSAAGAFNNGGGNPMLTMNLVNNLVVAATSKESYVAQASAAGLVTGNNDLFFGAGPAPAVFKTSVGADPMLVNAAGHDFHLLMGSPAIGAGAMSTATTDFDGNPRPQANAWDIGAYEYVR